MKIKYVIVIKNIRIELDFDLNTLIDIGQSDNASFIGGELDFKINIFYKNRDIGQASRKIIQGNDRSIVIEYDDFSLISNQIRNELPHLGSVIYQATEDQLIRATKHLPRSAQLQTLISIAEAANDGLTIINKEKFSKGAIVWAKHYYDFEKSKNTIKELQKNFIDILNNYAKDLQIPQSDLETIKENIFRITYPYEFTRMNYGLTLEQMMGTGLIDADIIYLSRQKKTYDIGTWLLQVSEISWPAVNYVHGLSERSAFLNQKRRSYRENLFSPKSSIDNISNNLINQSIANKRPSTFFSQIKDLRKKIAIEEKLLAALPQSFFLELLEKYPTYGAEVYFLFIQHLSPGSFKKHINFSSATIHSSDVKNLKLFFDKIPNQEIKDLTLQFIRTHFIQDLTSDLQNEFKEMHDEALQKILKENICNRSKNF